MLLRGHCAGSADFGDRQCQRLQTIVLEHDPPDLVGHRFEQRDPLGLAELARAFGGGQRDLDVDLIVRTIDARRIVDEVGVRTSAAMRELDPSRLRDSEIGALADDLGADVLCIHAQRVVGRVADLDVIFLRRLDIGADTAEPDEVDRGLQDRRDQRLGLDRALLDAQLRLYRLGQLDALGVAREDPAALGDQRAIVILPARAGEREQALALVPAGGRIGIGVEEDVAMVEGGDQLDRLGQQHPIAEHIARHVAATDDFDGFALHIDAHLEEVALYADPGTLGGDAHRLVVVAFRAAAGESIVEPEILRFGNRIGNIGEGRGALVCGDHEIGVLAIGDDHVIRMDDLVVDDVVGDRQQRADEGLVAGAPLGRPGLAVERRVGQLLGIEPALRAGRHDHCVLDPLRFHQPEDLGAEIVAPVGPAQAAARDGAAAQMDPLDPARIDEDFAIGDRLGEIGDLGRVDLESQRFGRCGGEGIGAQDRVDQRIVEPQQAVVIDRLDLGQAALDRGARIFDRLVASGTEFGIVTRGEQRDQRAGHVGRRSQRIDHGVDGEAHARLTQIAVEGA